MIAGCVGELLDALLSDLHPLADRELLADAAPDCGNVDFDHAEIASSASE
jgi:hypothetical protein